MKKYILSLLILVSCAHKSDMAVTRGSVKPGTWVSVRGKQVPLSKGNIRVGQSFLTKAKDTGIDYKFNKRVTIVSLVPSVDTKVCEAQTHILGETKGLEGIDLVTISRDLPMAQSRFADEAKLKNIQYYSDYKSGTFGKKNGLMMEGKELLARGVIVLDEKGVIRHMQIVDEVTKLPDMETAFQVARELQKKK